MTTYQVVKVSEHERSGLAYIENENRDVFYCPACFSKNIICLMQPQTNSLRCSDLACGAVVRKY